jgi:hypothetical protein
LSPSDRTKTPTRSDAANARPIASRTFRRRRRFAGDAQLGGIEANGGRRDLVVGDIDVANLPAGAAAENVRGRKHRAQLVITRTTRQLLARAEEENKIGIGAVAGRRGPTRGLAPRQLSHTHGVFTAVPERTIVERKSLARRPENSVYLRAELPSSPFVNLARFHRLVLRRLHQSRHCIEPRQMHQVVHHLPNRRASLGNASLSLLSSLLQSSPAVARRRQPFECREASTLPTLKGRTAVVTGAAGGIGRTIAVSLARRRLGTIADDAVNAPRSSPAYAPARRAF